MIKMCRPPHPYRDTVTVTVTPTLTQTHTVMLTLTLAPTRLPPAAYPDSNPDTSPNPYLTWLLAATRRASHRRGACRLPSFGGRGARVGRGTRNVANSMNARRSQMFFA